MSVQSDVYYFGCWDEAGHYLHHPNGHTVKRKEWEALPWGDEIDGDLCKKGRQTQGEALLHHKDGWTAVAFWDRSLDSRPGSNSVFVAKGEHDLPSILALATKHFPDIVKRFKFKIYIATEKPTIPTNPFR